MTRTEGGGMSETDAELRERVRALAAGAGLTIEGERLEGLVAQATPYLEMIRALDGMPAANEPAAVFRLPAEEKAQ